MILKEIRKNETGSGLLIEHDGEISIFDSHNKSLLESLGGANATEIQIPYPFKVSAVFQKWGLENANGRIYPKEILEREVEKYQIKIQERRSYGELNHPSECIIDGGRLSHLITELHWEGHTLVGELELLVSPGFVKMGIISNVADIVANNIAVHKLKVGVSSRGLGSVKKLVNKYVVDTDFDLVCWDIVTDPSTPGAWIGNTPEELKMYVETKEEDKNKLLIDKLDKFLLK